MVPPPTDEPLRLPPLPEDILLEILSRVSVDAVAVVRCAATCKTWRGLILEPSFLSHLQRRRAGGSIRYPLLGFFFRDTSQKLPRRRLYRRRPTRFLLLGPSESLSPALHLSHFLPSAARLDGFAPVASGASGLVALRRNPGNSRDPVRICVCNPVAGTSTFLPPLPHASFPENVVFLEAGGSSFRLLAVMDNLQMGLLLRVFSSQTGEWGTAVTAQLPDNMLVLLSSPGIVHRGAVHWICGTRALPNAVHALAVRLGQNDDASACRIDLPLRAGLHRLNQASRAVRLASSAQGCLSLVFLDESVLSIWNLQDNGAGGKSWALHKTVQVESLARAMLDPSADCELSVEALCEQSGSLFLRVAGEGLFVLNIDTERLTKVSKGHCVKHLCSYVADVSSCVAAMKKFSC